MSSTEEILKEIVELEEQSSKLEEQAQAEAKKIIEKAKADAEALIKEARKSAEAEIDRLVREEEAKSKDLLASIDKEIAEQKEALRAAQKSKGKDAVKAAMKVLLGE